LISLNTYRCLGKQQYSIGNYSIIPIREEDILSIKNWRNEQIKYLRQSKPLSEEDQIKYYKNVIMKTFNEIKPNQILFSFLLDQKCIGYGGLVHIDWNSQSAEVSFLTETKRADKNEQFSEDLNNFLKLIFIVAFEEIIFNQLDLETFEIDPLTIEILENFGFKLEKNLKKHVFINGKYFDSLIHTFLRRDYYLENQKI